ncbi:MAG: hypothetical protein HY302_16595 [Opitutae bacterium]|nr:hypothetical protein [Opitutae bacterium]
MKTLRPFFFAALLLGWVGATGALASPPATAPEPRTYAVLCFVVGPKPPASLLGQARSEVDAKMAGLVEVPNPEEADHVVQVLFKRGTFRLYVDALPLDGLKPADALGRLQIEGMIASEAARENAEGHGRK